MAKTNPGNVPALSKEERRKRQLAGLKPAKKGEVRNPTGKNGRSRSDYIISLLEELDEDGKSHIRSIVEQQIKRAKGRSDRAAQGLIDHYKGKARIEIDHKSSDGSMSPTRKPTTAETRQELDRVMEIVEKHEQKDEAPAGGAEGSEASAAEPKAQP